MGLKADYYEALTWKALTLAYSGCEVKYEPSREIHSCASLCAYSDVCTKPQVHPRLIHTIPDFLVKTNSPLFVHVFYWDSKETSHAKFWRTVSEIAELKCFVPNSESMCVVFEAESSKSVYRAAGWYAQFLEAMHLIFDRAIFFDSVYVEEELSRVRTTIGNRGGTASIYREISNNQAEYRNVLDLRNAIESSAYPSTLPKSVMENVWQREIKFCSSLEPYSSTTHLGEKLRNAILQIVLLMSLFAKDSSEVLDRLHTILLEPRQDFVGRDEMIKVMNRLPISNRDDQFQLVADNLRRAIVGPIQCSLSEDLTWLLNSVHRNQSSLPVEALRKGIESTFTAFSSSPQVSESLESINRHVSESAANFAEFASWDETNWLTAYESVPVDKEYNYYAEILIEATELGTYPLVSELNRRWPADQVTRNDIRSLYSNRRSARFADKRRELVTKLVALIGKNTDWHRVSLAYLHRKTSRIVGPQSAINPLSHLVIGLLEHCVLADGVKVVHDTRLHTLASQLVGTSQLGTWKVDIAFETPSQFVPLFLSAMKSPGDCAHKAREFAAHLRLARHAWDGRTLKESRVQRGIAVLEGGYSDDDKRAFHLSGYRVCSLEDIPQALAELGITRQAV